MIRTSAWSVLGILFLWASAGTAQEMPPEYRQGVVVTVSAPGSEAGLSILKAGGNAVDAAVATAFALAVTYPAAGNIGGGGFMMIHFPGGKATCIEYRETAPAAAHEKMYRKDESIFTHRAVGVPGTVRGMALAHAKYGKLPWKKLVEPAVRLARDGFLLDAHNAKSLNKVLDLAFEEHAELKRVFGKPGGGKWQEGDRLVQPDLARTLQRIADHGADGFYRGPVADMLAAEMKKGAGLITLEDLAAYQAKERTPIHTKYRGYDVYGPPPPSSGGITLGLMLRILERFDLKKHDRFSAPTLHLLAETMRRAYRDRARWLGDADFVKIPGHLLTDAHAAHWAKSIDSERATPSEKLAGDITLSKEGESTTHFSIIDRDGLAVSNTYTLEQSYGSRVVVRGAGFLLNNEMMDFNWRPGVTDRKGTIGTPANRIAPGKRMLSSQTPTIVAREGRVVLVTGSPGGRTIINTLLNVMVNVLDFEMPLREAIDAPRLHHQWFPDEIRFEGTKRFPKVVAELKALGHRVVAARQGDAHSIRVNPRTGGYVGVEDRRLSGKAVGY